MSDPWGCTVYLILACGGVASGEGKEIVDQLAEVVIFSAVAEAQ